MRGPFCRLRSSGRTMFYSVLRLIYSQPLTTQQTSGWVVTIPASNWYRRPAAGCTTMPQLRCHRIWAAGYWVQGRAEATQVTQPVQATPDMGLMTVDSP
ncbi:hypothetical protein FHL15_008953 [Xylaria flabelliformis]|uniref:Uncharacterized protein n=1 Tax=Xylaria flabelliformis TaxID=2512241 RepID=A0A553HQJ4_9PEZI|nr:hypothetical protein FHL15_008953 [Xylaria flabelliformis]